MPTGTLVVHPESNLTYSGFVSFDATVEDADHNAEVFIRVICTDGERVIYQWSSKDFDFKFPLHDQVGDNLSWPEDTGAYGYAELIHRVKKGKKFVSFRLAETTFLVEEAP